MDVFIDPQEDAENRNTDTSQLKRQSEVSNTPVTFARTPLMDVKNKQGLKSSGHFGSTKKQNVTHNDRLDALNLQTADTPRRQQKASNSRRSCFAAFHIPQDIAFPGDAPSGITLPRTIEEEPDISTIQVQGLEEETLGTSPVLAVNTLNQSEINLGSNRGQSPGIHSAVSSPQSHNSSLYQSWQIDMGTEVIVMSDKLSVDGMGGEDKYGNSYPATGTETPTQDHQTASGDADFALEDRSCFTADKTDENDGPAQDSVHSSLISMVEDETDQLVEMLVQECAADLAKDYGRTAVGSDPHEVLCHITQDHDYMKMKPANVLATSPSQSHAINISSSHESHSDQASSPHMLARDSYFAESEYKNSTPRPASCPSPFHNLITSQQSPTDQELANISNSSFRVNMQSANLSDLMETYLLHGSPTVSEGSSLSSPYIRHLLDIDLSPRISQNDNLQITPVKRTADESFTENVATIPDSPVIHFSNKTEMTASKICSKAETLSPNHARDDADMRGRIDLVDSSSALYMPNKKDHDSVIHTADKAENNFVMCTPVKSGKSSADTSSIGKEAEATAPGSPENEFIPVGMAIPTSLENAVTALLLDNLHVIKTSLAAEECQAASTAMNTSACQGVDIILTTDNLHSEACDKFAVNDGPEVVSSWTNTSTSGHADVSMVTDRCLAEVACVSTNTSVLGHTDVSVLTDHPQHALVNTSMVTDTCHGVDVSMITDTCHGTDVSMITDACQGTDVSLMTDNAATLDHSMMAIPDFLNKQTMTDKKATIDAESSMTPLKLGKQGKRLTAEEIRRQHPRIIANQLETTMSSNQRLEKEVRVAASERDHLRTVVKETKAKLASNEKQLEELKKSQEKHISMLEQLHEEAVHGLEACIAEKQQRIYDLETELKEARRRYEDAEASLTSTISEWHEKYEKLEKLRLESELHFAEEIQKLRTDYEEKSYQPQFQASQQVIRELQAEREEFLGLLDDIEGASAMQFRLRDALHRLATKLQKSAKEQALTNKQLATEYESMRRKYTSMEVDLGVAVSENKDLQDDIQNMNDILTRSNESLVELESMYQKVKQSLLESQTQVSELSTELASTSQVIADLTKTKEILTQQLSEQQDGETVACQALEEAKEKIRELEGEVEKEKQMFAVGKDIHEKMKAEADTTKAKLELYIQNLQHTLDSWEVDREVQDEELENCQQQLANQRAKMDSMATELAALRKIKATTQSEKELITELKNTAQFLEAEKALYLEAITDYRTKLEAETELAASNKDLIDALRSNNSELQKSYEQLSSDVQMLEEALSVKTMDLETTWTAMENLEERMETALASLQQKFGIEVKCDSAKKTIPRSKFATPKNTSSSFHSQSLVAQVLLKAADHSSQALTPKIKSYSFTHPSEISDSNNSATHVDQQKDHLTKGDQRKERPKQSNLEYGATNANMGAAAVALLSPHSHSFSGPSRSAQMIEDSKKSLSFCHPHEAARQLAFKSSSISTSLQKSQTSPGEDGVSVSTPDSLNRSVPGYAKIRSIPSTVDKTLERLSKATSGKGGGSKSTSILSWSSPEEVSGCSESDSLLGKVKTVERLFTMIMKTADMAERASELTIKDLKGDLELLKDKLRFQRCQISDLETDLTRKSSQLTSANSQIKELNDRISGMNQSLLNFHDQGSQITRLEEDKAELNRKLRDSEGQCKLLSEQLEEVITKVDDVKSGKKPDGACLRKIVALEKKNHELMMKLFDERDKSKELGEKAMRRMRILEGNWERAEAEVGRFDELVMKIRQTCIKNQAQSTPSVLLQVVRLIDG